MKTRWQIPLLVIAAWTARPPVRLTAQQRPWQATDYYKLTFVADPRLSPDGRRVAFTVTTVVEDKDRRHGEIWMAAADGSAPAYRYTSPSTEASSPSWSPDGSLLAFSSRREGSEEDVWFLRTGAPGGEAFQVKGVHGAPLFSRDGQWLLYGWRGAEPDSVKQQTWRTRVSPVAITRGPDPKRFDGQVYTSIPIVADERGFLPPRETRRPSHLYIVPFAGGAGGEARQLTSGDLSQTSPAWSPDGKTIVFVQDSTETIEVRDEPRPQLYLLTVADGSIRQLATGFPESGDPAWSPDGKVIAFSCSKGRGQENDLCVIPAGGGAARNLTADWSLDPGSPAWSPDGKTLYFSAETRGNLHLFAVAATGGAVRQVTTGERQLRGFSHSADGRSVAYAASDITHPAEVFVATLTGGGGGGGGRTAPHLVQRLAPRQSGAHPRRHVLVHRGGRAPHPGLVDEAAWLPVRQDLPARPLDPRRAPLELRQCVVPGIPDARRPGLLDAVHQPARLERLRAHVHVRHARAVGNGGLSGLDAGGGRRDRSRWGGHDADGGAGWIVRRIHDQLDRGPHQSLPRGPNRPVDFQLVLLVRLVRRPGAHRLRVFRRAVGGGGK